MRGSEWDGDRITMAMLIRHSVPGGWATALTLIFFFSSRRRHTRLQGDWSSDVCSSDLGTGLESGGQDHDSGGRIRLSSDRSVMPGRIASFFRNLLRKRAIEQALDDELRSEERRVGEECRSRWSAYHLKKKKHSEP